MKGYIGNIEQEALGNQNFRKVLYTSKFCQLVVMSIPVGGDIGEEVHTLDQFFRCEAGTGKAVLDGVEHELSPGMAVIVPAGTKHNLLNTSEGQDLKLYTVYSPPNHKDGTVHVTKEDAEKDEEHFDGILSE